jgi:GT2 family glycosyltransferase
MYAMKLSVVILCWNDLKVVGDCLRSIYANTHAVEFEVLVSDNGSTDGVIEFVRANFPQVRLLENGVNLRFAKGNNVAFRHCQGEYVLILNPDTIVHEGSLDKLVAYADRHPEAGAFGCRMLYADGSYQQSCYPFPSLRREWINALCLRPLAHLSDWFIAGLYPGWHGEAERKVDWLSGCCILIRGDLLQRLGGFDEQFFYYYEDTDLCRRVWDTGFPILYTPEPTVTHLIGTSTKQRLPIGFELDKYVTRYRYYYKHFGTRGVRRCRRASLAWLFLRLAGLGFIQLLRPSEARKLRLELYKVAAEWNLRVDPIRLVEKGEEPQLAIAAMTRVLDR